MPTFKELIVTGHEVIDPIKRKIWRFKEGEFWFDDGYMFVCQPPRYITSESRLTNIISLSDVAHYKESNK